MERFEIHLAPLKQTSKIEIWTDQEIGAGGKWEAAILTALSQATIAVLLITADFLGSDFIRNKEIPVLLDRRDNKGLRLFPILAKHCPWKLSPWIEEMQLRPVDAKPVWRKGGDAERDLALIVIEINAFVQVAKEAMEKLAEEEFAHERLLPLLPEKPAHEKIERERLEKEASVSSLMRSVHDSLAAVDKQDYRSALSLLSSRFQAEAQKEQMQRWQVLQDTQAKIFDVLQSATLNKARRNQESYKKWDEYIRQA
jgi:TIR domain-containing protein